MNLLNIFDNRAQMLKKARKIVTQIDSYKNEMRALSGIELKNKTKLFRKRMELGETVEDMLPEALAVVREAAYRAHGLFAYQVQLIGAIIIFLGDFAEMKTGEGKTLAIVLAAYIGALDGKGCHIVTVNEYLVKRDAEFCRRVLNFLGVTVGFNTAELSREVKKSMFNCDVTYTTNSELGFDYLRDNMVKNYHEKVIRDLNFVIIDEGDSVLIDEARTPLIISGQPQQNLTVYVQIDRFVKTLLPGDYKIDPETKSINLLSSGIAKCQAHFKVENLYAFENSDLIHKINNALTANYVFENGKEYVVGDDKILLVDHFTGRILAGRSYNAGLHQAIQAKESVTIDPENYIIATITYQSFFRQYRKLSSLSGTALTEAGEFMNNYNMVVVPIPTNKPVIRKDRPDVMFGTKEAKWDGVVLEIKKRFLTGQPVLVGTSSVEDSELLHRRLVKEKIPHEILNAKNHAREAEIVAKAGTKYAITISTNMAGRGTDIKLSQEARRLGGLFVLGTERHESRRIDNQLRGRSGRQGDIGESIFYISLEDDLFKRFASNRFEKLSKKIDDSHFDSKLFSKTLTNMQKKVESVNFDMRKNLIEYDRVLAYQRELVYKQRDIILTTQNNHQIMTKIINKVVHDVIQLFVDANNNNVINNELLAESLNEKMFQYPMLLKEDFYDLSITEANTFLAKVLVYMLNLKLEIINPKTANGLLKEILISHLDHGWQKHIDLMSKLRDSVSLRSLEQKSPLNIYVEEGDIIFQKFLSETAHASLITFLNYNIPGIDTKCYEYLQKLRQERKAAKTNKIQYTDEHLQTPPTTPNDPTPSTNPSSQLSAIEQLFQMQQEAMAKNNTKDN